MVRRMSVNNQRKVLEMLAEKKISIDEAERLLTLLPPEKNTGTGEEKVTKNPPKYLRVVVRPNPANANPGAPENVNIRVPITLVRAGMKFASLIPPGAYNQVDSALKEKGIQFDMRDIKPENIEELIAALNDLEVDINDPQQYVHIYTE
jgi:hypothetical protein